MMSYQVSPQDFELLSAYLDLELSPSERLRLESRLQTETDLKEALNDLRKTRLVLRSLPVMRAPRNFTLTPEMAGIKPRRENVFLIWFARMRLSSALAAVLLVLVLLGDFLSGATLLPASPTAADLAASEPSLMEAAPEESTLKVPEQVAPIFVTPQVEAPMTPESERVAPGFSMQENGESVTVEVLPTSTPAPEAPAPQLIPRGQGGGGGGFGGGGEAADTQPVSEPLLSGNQLRILFRTIEITLAITVLATALAAWLLNRRR